ncbi:MAG: RNA pyrophosphohydrolase [Betaproteobacteria bacterium TMED82]|nr:MAG: RNA pyrophosphohydrolase [Betaproteobacteria bacterium TMED82]|tara:strand:+ start:9221 stop:9736 length:516 start_codon:yes stop_codon:yes gene_type:complete
MLDDKGYRPNVGIIIVNPNRKVFWAKRTGEQAWQFPQGGVKKGESVDSAMFRELKEETGLTASKVEAIGKTRDWLYYDVPHNLIKKNLKGLPYKGQKQIWYLLKFLGTSSNIRLGKKEEAEFDGWKWIEYHDPVRLVINFKKEVYCKALAELAPLLFRDQELEDVKLKLSR